jgi:class 3 adenylate cyclase/tetratricopeptide (TPR) repeat protein
MACRQLYEALLYNNWFVLYLARYSAVPEMKCPKCQHNNTPNAIVCARCVAPLEPACTRCGEPVPPKAKFCPQCGIALKRAVDESRSAAPNIYSLHQAADTILTPETAITSGTSPAGERKQITVLFADIKDSMELLSQRDPEDAQKLLDPVLERMIEAVHRYDGTVNRVMGDGIMALFGAPLAHEDHAVQACCAALRMQETVTKYAVEVQRSHGVPVAIRVGLNSGEIIVYAPGDDLHIDYTIVGQPAHLASRMEQMAKPGCVLTTSATFRLAEGYIAMTPLGPMAVRGLADPVEIYEVTGIGEARTRLQAATGRGWTPYVGRDPELEALRSAQQIAGRGQGQVVAIVGEAGVGKSRLVQEFVQSPHAEGWLVLESNSASYGPATPYQPVIELLRHYFKISGQDSTRSIREKVAERILTLDPALQEAIPPVLDLLDSLEGDHPFRSLDLVEHRRCTYQAVVRLLLSESRARPVIAVFEDLHCSDSLSLGLLNELVLSAQSARLLLMVNYRSHHRDEWGNRPNYCQIRLHPLASENLGNFLQALLGSDPTLPTLKDFLAERANGNPFFAEEIVRALVDGGALTGRRGSYRLSKPFASIDVPPTVHAVLAARIDALPIAEKHLLQEAAVIGQDAPFGLLRAVCGFSEDALRRLLENLQAAEFLHATEVFSDLHYTFNHSLTREVTYSSVLHERRRLLHERVLRAIEKVYAERLPEQVERLAHHAVRGELKEKAVQYLREAGAKAVARSALLDARAWFEQALDVVKALPESSPAMELDFEIRLELRPVLRQLGEGRKMLEHLREAQSISERLSDDLRQGRVCAFMTTVLSTFDDLDEAVMTGTRALAIARRLGDLKLRVVTTSYLEQAHYYRGEYEHAIEFLAESLAAMPADWAHEYFGMAVPASVFGRAYLIMSLGEVGRFAEAAKYDTETMQLVEATQDGYTVAWARFAASMLQLLKGDWTKAWSQIDRWLATLQYGNIQLPWALAASAWALAQIGEASEALKVIRQGEQLLELQVARGIVAHGSSAYHAVGRACLLLGRLDDARRLGDHSVEFAQRQPGVLAHALHLLGDIAAHPGRFDPESSATHYRKALTLAQLHGMRPLVAHCHRGLGTLSRRVGEAEQAREHLTSAATMYREMGMDFWLEQAKVGVPDSGHARPAVEILGLSR